MIYNPISSSFQYTHWYFHSFWFSDQILRKNNVPYIHSTKHVLASKSYVPWCPDLYKIHMVAFLQKICATLEQGMMKSLPLHIQIQVIFLNLFLPRYTCHCDTVQFIEIESFTAHSPPAIVGDFTGSWPPSGPHSSERGTSSHLKHSPQRTPPQAVDKHICTDPITWSASHGLPSYDSQQGLQSHHIHFTVAVQQHRNFRSPGCSNHSSSDHSLSFCISYYFTFINKIFLDVFI